MKLLRSAQFINDRLRTRGVLPMLDGHPIQHIGLRRMWLASKNGIFV